MESDDERLSRAGGAPDVRSLLAEGVIQGCAFLAPENVIWIVEGWSPSDN